LLVHPSAADKTESGALNAATQRTLDLLLTELPLKTAVKLCADITGQPRNTLYEAALAQRKSRQTEED
jgi:16S rRNA (cytidine1402-2'-O)-methyltransferase